MPGWAMQWKKQTIILPFLSGSPADIEPCWRRHKHHLQRGVSCHRLTGQGELRASSEASEGKPVPCHLDGRCPHYSEVPSAGVTGSGAAELLSLSPVPPPTGSGHTEQNDKD